MAHAKLLRKLNAKLKDMIKLLDSDKQAQMEQKTMSTSLKSVYTSRKLKYKTFPSFPKFVFHTKLNLDVETYRNWYVFGNVITENDLKTFKTNEANHVA